jgi:hypothetical protein
MSDNSFDKEWELSSGLPLDGMTATITAAEFSFRQNIAKDTLFACLTFTPDQGEEAEQAFSTGKGWVAAGKGSGCVDANGKNRNFNNQTGYGKWIATAIELDGVKEALRGRNIGLKEAAAWVGLRFTLGIREEETTNPTTGQKSMKSRIVPVEFHGVIGTAKAVAASGKTVVALDADLDATLVALAGSFDSHDSFMAAAFDVTGVAGNAAAENAVMASGKGSVWARGQAAG